MRFVRRNVLRFMACAGAMALARSAAWAESYPERPIRVLVGFTASSAADLTARVFANRMTQTLGQQLVVENKPGSGSSTAAETAARATNDGYALFVGGSPNVTNAALNPRLPFDFANDFSNIALLTRIPVVLVTNPETGVKSVAELIALAKSRPGELLYGSSGVGTAPHLSAELFSMRIGVKLVHVPYPGTPQAVADLMAGRIAMMFSPASTVLPQVAAGKLIALATAADARPSTVPDLPTMAEAGLTDFDTSIWFGLLAPKGTSSGIVTQLARAVSVAQQDAEVVRILRAQGFEPIQGGPDDLRRYVQTETVKWKRVAEAAGLTQ